MRRVCSTIALSTISVGLAACEPEGTAPQDVFEDGMITIDASPRLAELRT